MQNIGNFNVLNEVMDGITRWEDLYNYHPARPDRHLQNVTQSNSRRCVLSSTHGLFPRMPICWAIKRVSENWKGRNHKQHVPQ